MDEQNQGQNQEYAPVEKNQEINKPEKKQTGSIIGSIIVIIVIIIGGLYFWGAKNFEIAEPEMPSIDDTPQETNNDPISDALNNASESDELDAIESDLETTEIDSIDNEINQ